MRSPQIEQVLEDQRLPYEYIQHFDISKVDRTKSQQNQARIEAPIDLEVVRQYRDLLQEDVEFPGIVLFYDGSTNIVSDGNHRLEANALVGNKVIDAYLVVCDDPVTRMALTFKWNMINGYGRKQDDADQHAVFLVKQGMTNRQVSRHLGMSTGRVEDALSVDAGHTRAVTLNIKAKWAKLSKSAKIRVQRDADLDAVFSSVVKLAAKFELNNREIFDLLKDLKIQTSEADKLTYIALKSTQKQKEADAVRDHKKVTSTNRGKNPRALTNAHLEYLAKHIVAQFDIITQGFDTAEIAEFLSRIETTEAALGEAKSLLKARI